MASESFDYVIVGGGTAGLVVAARLSENPQHRVLVLEAGKDQSADPRVQIPALYDSLKNTDADWGFSTVPQPHLNGRRVPVNQGKALGGSSAINAQVFVPPAKALIDAWETLGNPGWNWDALKPYFDRAYTSPRVNAGLEKKAVGIGEWTASNDAARGPIQTSFPGDSSHPIREAWAETFKASGLATTHDPFLEASVGSFSCLATVDPVKKERSYAVTAYYHPARDRANLRVITGARVLKIDFDAASDAAADPPAPVRATAVQYQLDSGERRAVAVGRDVILAAGAFQTPKVLELSGIGDAALLARHGIRVVRHLPGVGENLHDHPLVGSPAVAFERPAGASGGGEGPAPGKFVSIGALLSHPLSRGSVHIASGDPLADPAIDPGYLSNPLDEEVLAHHLLHILTTAASPPLASLLRLAPDDGAEPEPLPDLETAKARLRLEGNCLGDAYGLGCGRRLPSKPLVGGEVCS
ncbi:0d69f2b2-7972-48b9-ad5f-b070102e1b4d [Thermothielavioides terrestris]|uniref:0d69f2b2-7972-48b9-ad5f-b070102e1b4d n=1 Tax=Thermothielavioides terrestris TaxID=2587410 RepID=A0A3S4ALY4_9PEZI|nr:0d69f2b2-7972-48b9-ad5f-b070102e1b4d [Thermothielavioides terrestris]